MTLGPPDPDREKKAKPGSLGAALDEIGWKPLGIRLRPGVRHDGPALRRHIPPHDTAATAAEPPGGDEPEK